MANSTFLDFNLQNTVNSGDYLVGYNSSATGEIRVPINVGINTSGNTLSITGSLSSSSFIGVSYRTPNFDYLAAVGTYTSLFTVPVGYRFAVDSLTCTIDAAAGTYTAGTSPTIAAIYSVPPAVPSYSTAVRLQDRTFGTANLIGGTYIKASAAAATDSHKTAPAGSVVSAIISVANLGTSYTVLNGTVIVSGYLY